MKSRQVISRQFIVLGSLIAFVALAVSSLLGVRAQVRRVESERAQVLRDTDATWLPLLARAVWVLADQEIQMIVLAILQQDYVEHVELDITGQPGVSIGTRPEHHERRVTWPVRYDRGDRVLRVATLSVSLHQDTFAEVFREQLPSRLPGDVLRVSVVLAAVFLLVHFTVTRPLSRLRESVSSLTARLDGQTLGSLQFRRRKLFPEDDELDDVVRAFNSLLDSIREEREIRTDRERDLEASLQQSRFLLREVHHRVKNNLQMLISLLSLQAQHLDASSRTALLDAERRIRSLALVHIHLYQEGTVSSVELRSYASSLIRNLADTMRGGADSAVSVSVRGDTVDVPLDLAIPLALVLNEIATNAVKHAFAPGNLGGLMLEIERRASDVVVSLSDDGRGVSGDFSLTESANFGLTVVATLVEQIGGVIRHESPATGGTRFVVTVPLPAPAAVDERPDGGSY